MRYRVKLKAIILVALLAGYVTVPLKARSDDNCGSLTRLTIALNLISALNPDFKGADLRVTISEGPYGSPKSTPTQARNFGVTIDKLAPQAAEIGESDSARLDVTSNPVHPLYLSFDFTDFGGRKIGTNAVCHPVHFLSTPLSDPLQAARAEINSHPEWGDAESLLAAKKYGLRFGPKEKSRLVELLPLEKLRKFYGALCIKQARFEIASEHEKDAAYSFAKLTWSIIVEEVGTLRTIDVSVDPFTGKVIGLSESDEMGQ